MRRLWFLVCGLSLLGFAAPSAGQAPEMPDPALIHGRALPAPELPDGTVTVRVVREAIGNDVPGQKVDVVIGNATRSATTDAEGRAQFSGLPDGEAIASVTVDGEALVSQPFRAPSSGGLRVILVAGMARASARRELEAATAAAAPAIKGVVVLGSNSRVVMEFNNDALTAFYILEIVNSARARVDTGGPLVIQLPEIATSASAMEGSSPQAVVSGRQVTITGPFASGSTSVQVAFRLPHTTSTLAFSQTWPVALQQVTVGVEKVGALSMASPQFTTTGDVRADGGTIYVLGSGGALAAGTPLTVTLSNLPTRSRMPRNAALAIVLAIAGCGVWMAWKPAARRAESRQTMIRRRDTLLGDLAQLDSRRPGGGQAVERHATRRRQIVAELEQIYGELDEVESGVPEGGGEGVAT
jgi:hypothetical protein